MIFKVTDLVELIRQFEEDKIEYVELSLLEPEDDDPGVLCAEAVLDRYANVDYDPVEAVELPDDYSSSVTIL